jgi:hypothetical protein
MANEEVTVQEMHERTGKPIRTIYDWQKTHPELIEVIKLGCIAQRKLEQEA